MKKAKLMLSVLGVCALLATAFAFKAQTFNKHKLFFNNGTGTGCTEELSGFTITSTNTGLVRASTVSVATNCPETYTTTIDDAQ